MITCKPFGEGTTGVCSGCLAVKGSVFRGRTVDELFVISVNPDKEVNADDEELHLCRDCLKELNDAIFDHRSDL